jgi:DNA repair protein RadA/Sms
MARYTRLYPDHSQADDFFYTTSFESIKDAVQTYGYQFIIVDSIQTIMSASYDGSPGSAGQVRTCAELLNDLAKEHHVTIVVIGHVTKGGEIA